MDAFSFLFLFAGLALFLCGVSLMGGALEHAVQGRAQKALRRLTGTPLRGMLLGAAVTAAVQSSSAAAVMTAGLVGAGAIPLEQAVGVIMGANIGTTVTAHLLRLSGGSGLLRLLSPASLASAAVISGAALSLAAKDRQRTLGQLLLGFGLLFTGMLRMEAAVAPLRKSPAFLRLFQKAENPLLGVLAGAAVTAVIQSSSASVGILQAAASTGAVSWAAAIPILLGQNIGTCATPFLAFLGGGRADRGARQAAMVHLLLNLLGSGLFLTAVYGIGLLSRAPFWQEPVTKGGIADFHTFFNLTTALVLLPFTGPIARLAERWMPLAPSPVVNKL